MGDSIRKLQEVKTYQCSIFILLLAKRFLKKELILRLMPLQVLFETVLMVGSLRHQAGMRMLAVVGVGTPVGLQNTYSLILDTFVTAKDNWD